MRSLNSQLAVDLYTDLLARHSWTGDTAWQGIARLLLSCEVYRYQWRTFRDVVTYVESNRFTIGEARPSAALRRAEELAAYLAAQLSVDRRALCRNIGLYWQHPDIRPLQPHNLVGYAFRSLTTAILSHFGDQGVRYEEEVVPHAVFPEPSFAGLTRNRRIDVVARRGGRIVALLGVSWRVRHNRLVALDDMAAYAPATYRQNPNAKLYVVLGEFDGGRLRKVLANCAPILPHPAISAAIHFAPQLIREGLGENGTLEHLQSLAWLIGETFRWA